MRLIDSTGPIPLGQIIMFSIPKMQAVRLGKNYIAQINFMVVDLYLQKIW